MSRYIEVDALEEIKEIADDAFEWGTYVVKMSAIREVPTADVVEVVRCKDCKYYTKHQYMEKSLFVCNVFEWHSHPNDYCSFGERREDEC